MDPMCIARRGVIWAVMGCHGTPQPPMQAWGPSLYGLSWGVLWHVMGPAMGDACVHPSHLHSKCQHSNTPNLSDGPEWCR